MVVPVQGAERLKNFSLDPFNPFLGQHFILTFTIQRSFWYPMCRSGILNTVKTNDDLQISPLRRYNVVTPLVVSINDIPYWRCSGKSNPSGSCF